jgi:hypothetical protein
VEAERLPVGLICPLERDLSSSGLGWKLGDLKVPRTSFGQEVDLVEGGMGIMVDVISITVLLTTGRVGAILHTVMTPFEFS